MEVNTYNEYLIKLIESNEKTNSFNLNIKIDLYLTLLSLNNNNYNHTMFQNDINIAEDFLRKINNLKVKIQLKRKEEEINKLIDDIKEIYLNYSNIINRFNRDNTNIITILDSKNPLELTNILDKLTKEKIKIVSNKDYYNEIKSDIKNNNYTINNDGIIINNKIINIDELYDMFSYLLDINNYKNIYPNEEKNELHNNLIQNIIDVTKDVKEIENEKIPMILTHILTKEIKNYETINTEHFIIENIKITDLYSFAGNNELNNTAKWQKINIPNEFLYKKLQEAILTGMYYFKDNNFIIESIENNISNFKTCIEIKEIINFIKENLENKSA